MELIKFEKVVSVNSETQGHEGQLLINPAVDLSKSWLCEKGSEKGVVILKLERATVIIKVDIGNAHSAFIEVLVGRVSDSMDKFQTLIPTSTFMSPNESKTGVNKNQVRFFTKTDFDQEAVGKQWDLVKIVCSQPFDKQVPFGLCFIKIHGETIASLHLKPAAEPAIAIGSFFHKRKDVTNEGEKTLSIDERIRKAQTPEVLAKHSPLSAAKLSEEVKGKHSSPGNTPRQTDSRDNRRNRDLGLDDDEPTPKKSKHDEKTPKDDSKERERQKRKEREKKLQKMVAEKAAKEEENRKQKAEEQRDRDKKEKRKEADTSRARRKRKPFNRLLEDVVFVLSGYQNPERANYRSHAIAMGARYSQDWTDSCTHLVASYINTPKCNQVKGKGKIVSKDWVEKCYNDKKRYPWRRFALDKADRGKPESEDEIEAGNDSPIRAEPTSPSGSSSSFSSSQRAANTANTTADSPSYDNPTDDEDGSNLISTLPDFFSGQTFYVDDSIADKAVLERYIIAYNGVVSGILNNQVKYLVTLQRGTALKILKKDLNCQAVSPTWIQSVNCSQKLIPATHFIVE